MEGSQRKAKPINRKKTKAEAVVTEALDKWVERGKEIRGGLIEMEYGITAPLSS